MPMLQEHTATELQALAKENRILKKKLTRSEENHAKLEETKRNKESLLNAVIVELQESQAILEKKSSDLEQAVAELTLMRDKLVEAEKMSALATLVAGISHEINTPVGTSITLASTLADETAILNAAVTQGQLKRSALNDYLSIATESTALLMSNLNRAGDLIQSFKQVAVDQIILEQRTFRIKEYIEEVLASLAPHLKKTSHTLIVQGDESLEINSYPGALAQITTNFITNSLTHAFESLPFGEIFINISECDHQVRIQYTDNGCGIPPENLGKIFDPFFTTARNRGGTGLGLNIVYNLVTQKLQGTIEVQSEMNQGTHFNILLPLSIADAVSLERLGNSSDSGKSILEGLLG
jgi:two-component system, NtrC family, sensor kinase